MIDHEGIGTHRGVVHWICARCDKEFEKMESTEKHNVGGPLEPIGRIIRKKEEKGSKMKTKDK